MRPDPLTHEERAEVERRIKAKAVQVVPPGVVSFQYPVWDGMRLVQPEGANPFRGSMDRFHGKGAKPRMKKRAKQAPATPQYVVDRRARVAALHADNKTIPEIMVVIGGVTHFCIRNDLARLGLMPHVGPHHNRVDHAAREARVRALAAQGCSAWDVAEDIGIHIDSVRKLAADLGVTLARKRRSDAGSALGVAAARVAAE